MRFFGIKVTPIGLGNLFIGRRGKFFNFSILKIRVREDKAFVTQTNCFRLVQATAAVTATGTVAATGTHRYRNCYFWAFLITQMMVSKYTTQLNYWTALKSLKITFIFPLNSLAKISKKTSLITRPVTLKRLLWQESKTSIVGTWRERVNNWLVESSSKTKWTKNIMGQYWIAWSCFIIERRRLKYS